ncbi:MAG: hypothetical protein AUI50_01045 [Crenarchaeota archaeon 13_1_40CM_2_52_14]|nr:MAG: hypothetical protein AUI97_08350 [Crenarchaeota archaeon 13_1_40CM_3_52_17]OLD35720.1 MAG: hypothetical protein AUI50_01045 [Crenarchaeota archaeon 13_1_40CM_2_52_14]OLE68827.1 MAG: hypothetical protein AUF78_14350 [archaeon 13_1_20CM_2_51_12]
MSIPVYLDLVAMVAPALSIWLLLRQKQSFVGIARHNLIRLNIYFFLILAADIDRILSQSIIATYVMLVGFSLIAMNFGHAAAVVQFCPEARTLGESLKIIFKKTILFPLYLLILGIWLAVTLTFEPVTSSLTMYGNEAYVLPAFPIWYIALTVAVAAPIVLYPSLLLLSSLNRAQTSYTRNSLLLMLSSWLCFPTVGLVVFFLLSPVIPFSYELGLIISSALYCLLAVSIRTLPGTTRFLKSSLFPQSLIKFGKRYLVLHDTSTRSISFLSSAFRSTIEAGAKVVLRSPATWLVEGLSRNDSRFKEWTENGKFVTSSTSSDDRRSGKEGLSDKFGLSQTATVFVKELERQDLQGAMISIKTESRNEPEAEVLLLESSQAPRPQVADFLQKNGDVELVNLSEASDPFSALVNLDHAKIEGSKILLEYSSNSNFEDLVRKFFDEGIANAEMCTLFTSKSSKLYRALKGKRMVRMVAASSMVSAPDESPDGEIQIPDKELGLVTSLMTDLFENNRSVALSFVFDSITELIRGERWEQVYSGIKQLIELLSPSTVTAIFLVNKETTEERFLGALRGLFSVQMSLDDTEGQALRVVKAEF